MISTVVTPQHIGKRESEKNPSLAPQKLPSHEGRKQKGTKEWRSDKQLANN